MKTFRSTHRTMRLVLMVVHLGLVLKIQAQIPLECLTSNTNRPPVDSDITVVCGSQYMDLSIFLCPVYSSFYNESLMVLNNQHERSECYGEADWTAVPPVLKFRFALNESSVQTCNNEFKVTEKGRGTGPFSVFSKVHYVNISGSVTSVDPLAGTITYRPQVLYKFSCYYPLQYIVNNTQLDVSGVNLAVQDKNGSFISTLSMELYEDQNYQTLMLMPDTGLDLKTKIYVEVKATNLTKSFNVLLDHCWATTSPFPSESTSYDLLVGCSIDPQTKVTVNGVSQKAQFVFEAFRFVEHKDQRVSTFYLHCATKLCEVSACSNLLPNCAATARRRRRRREAEAEDVLVNTTVTSTAILVSKERSGAAQTNSAPNVFPSSLYSGPVVSLMICVVILSLLVASILVYIVLQRRDNKPIS